MKDDMLAPEMIINANHFVTTHLDEKEKEKLKELLPEDHFDMIIKDPELLMSLFSRLYYADYGSYKKRKKDKVFLKDHPTEVNIKIITYE